MFRSEDNGAAWQSIAGFNDHPMRPKWVLGGTPDGEFLHSILVDPRDPMHLYLAISVGGVFESTDGGSEWTPLNEGVAADFLPDPNVPFGHDPHTVALCAANPDRLYQQNHCGIYRLDRPSRRWERIGNAMPKKVGDIGFPIVLHPSDADTAWVFPMDGTTVWPRTCIDGKPAVYVTRNGGRTWQKQNKGLPGSDAWLTVMRQAMCTDAHDPPGLYFGTTGGEVWASGLATRYLVNDACVLLRKPLVAAAIHRFEGQAMTYVPGRGPCYRCLFPDATTGPVPNCAEAGVLGVLPGVLGTLQATEAIKLIAGVGEPLVGRLLTYDALEMRFDVLSFVRRGDCEVCGDRPTIAEPRDPPGFCSEDALRAARRLTPLELQTLLREPRAAPSPLAVVDVREPKEFAVRTLPGAVNIPIGELHRRLREIPPGATPVFLCRSGARSLRACGIAIQNGFAAPAHLEGGLLAWAADLDASFDVAPL